MLCCGCPTPTLHDLSNGIALWARSILGRASCLPASSWLACGASEASLVTSASLLITVLAVLRLSKSYIFGDGMYLRRRVLLLAEIRTAVTRWEEACLTEVGQCFVDVEGDAAAFLRRYISGRQASELVHAWATASTPTAAAATLPHKSAPALKTSSFFGIVPSVAFADAVVLKDLLELAYVAEVVLVLPADQQLLDRLNLILRYMLLRRVSLMEEAEIYQHLQRRVLFPTARYPRRCIREGGRGAAWRLHRRPTWLAPLASGSGFLCLPRSYFPIEAVLPYRATESWLSDRLLRTVLPRWEKQSARWLRQCTAPTAPRSGKRRNYPNVMETSKVHFLFLRYAAPLLRSCAQRQRHAARVFAASQLLLLAGCEKSSNGTFNPCPGSFEVLWRCLTRSFVARYQRSGAPPEVLVSAGGHPGGENTASSMTTVASGIRRSLIFRELSHALVIALEVFVPRFSLRYATELAVASCVERSTTLNTSGVKNPVSSPVEELLRSMAVEMGWVVAGGVAEVLTKHSLGVTGQQLSRFLSETLTQLLQKELLHVDEAFYVRWLQGDQEEAEHAHEWSSSTPAETRPASLRFPASRPSSTVDDVLAVGRRGGEQILRWHDAMVTRTLRCVLLTARAVFTGEWRELSGAAVTACIDVPSLLSAFCVAIGYSIPQDVSRLLSHRDGGLPATSPWGWRLLLEILVDDFAAGANCRARPGSSYARKGPRQTPLHPFLSLLACSSVWNFDYLLADRRRCPEDLLTFVHVLKEFYRAVVAYRYDQGNCAAKWLPTVAACPFAAAKEDVRCVLHYSVQAVEQACEERCPMGVGSPTSPDAHDDAPKTLHPLLDPEETALLHQPSALAYLSDPLDYFQLFSKPHRFLLRQLGLEMVFAYRTAAGMSQSSRQMAEEWWTQTLFSGTFNPLSSVLQEVVELATACATVLLFCLKVENGALQLCPMAPTLVWQRVHVMRCYRDVLRSGVAVSYLEDGLCPVQQLCENLPCDVLSVPKPPSSPTALTGDKVPSALQQRRRQWRRHLAHTRPELWCDAEDRIVGGLRLRDGVEWHHVYFAYPQLFTTATTDMPVTVEEEEEVTGGVRPTLIDVSFVSPAVGMTAVVGPSGAGKSSLSVLLRRLYDPLPVVECDDCCAGCPGRRSSQRVPVALGEIGGASNADDVLVEVLRLALVESVVPLPPPATGRERNSPSLPPLIDGSSAVESPIFQLRLQPGYLSLDGIPLSIFAGTYVRQWFGWLPQTPQVHSGLSVASNVCGTTPYATLTDVQRALHTCCCERFLQEKGRTIHDILGPLSGGEGQRVALARAVVAQLARARIERLYGIPLSSVREEEAPRLSAVGGLVLDEPTSRLDAMSELQLLTALAALQDMGDAGETKQEAALPLLTWVLSHRMSTIRRAAHMVVVEAGRVTASGLQTTVMRENKFAARQRELQLLTTPPAEDGKRQGDA